MQQKLKSYCDAKIKKLFNHYRAFVKNSEVAPILLFNEADAVLGIRQQGAQQAVGKILSGEEPSLAKMRLYAVAELIDNKSTHRKMGY